MHVISVKILKDYRCLRSGLTIDLQPVTLLVGEQGCGKSSLLKLLQTNSDILKMTLSKDTMKHGVSTFYFDTESMNPRVCDLEANYTTPGGESKGIGIGAALSTYFMSHGEALRNFTIENIKDAEKCFLMIDEPEAALSLKNQYKLIKEIKSAVHRDVQIIASSHCLPLIESFEHVYSLEHLKWMTSKEFIQSSKL